jgi:hypothetical protein
MSEYRSEYVSGENYEILRQGTIESDGTYCILEGGPKLILTVPKEVGKERIEKVFEGVYQDYQWGMYYQQKTKRWSIPVSDLDQDKLEGCVKRL